MLFLEEGWGKASTEDTWHSKTEPLSCFLLRFLFLILYFPILQVSSPSLFLLKMCQFCPSSSSSRSYHHHQHHHHCRYLSRIKPAHTDSLYYFLKLPWGRHDRPLERYPGLDKTKQLTQGQVTQPGSGRAECENKSVCLSSQALRLLSPSFIFLVFSFPSLSPFFFVPFILASPDLLLACLSFLLLSLLPLPSSTLVRLPCLVPLSYLAIPDLKFALLLQIEIRSYGLLELRELQGQSQGLKAGQRSFYSKETLLLIQKYRRRQKPSFFIVTWWVLP